MAIPKIDVILYNTDCSGHPFKMNIAAKARRKTTRSDANSRVDSDNSPKLNSQKPVKRIFDASSRIEEPGRYFKALIEQSYDVIVVSDKTAKNLYVSPSIKRVLGYRQTEFLKSKPLELIHPDDLPVVKKLLAALIKKPNKNITGQCRLRHKDRSWKWMEFVLTNLLKDQNIAAIVINFRDITERKEYERRGDCFISTASHELKTPISTIYGYTQILRKTLQEADSKKLTLYVHKMDNQLKRLTELLDDLINVTRIQYSELKLKKEVFPIDGVVEEAVLDAQNMTDHHSIIVEGKSHKKIRADKYCINQVLDNLLSNAIKFSPRSDKIIVRILNKLGAVNVSVQDFGIGIYKRDLDKVFDRFFQAETRIRQSFSGMGLGLYISSEIIKKHKGRIWVESEKGKGATFSFALPVLKN